MAAGGARQGQSQLLSRLVGILAITMLLRLQNHIIPVYRFQAPYPNSNCLPGTVTEETASKTSFSWHSQFPKPPDPTPSRRFYRLMTWIAVGNVRCDLPEPVVSQQVNCKHVLRSMVRGGRLRRCLCRSSCAVGQGRSASSDCPTSNNPRPRTHGVGHCLTLPSVLARRVKHIEA